MGTFSSASETPRGQSPQLWSTLRRLLSEHEAAAPVRLLDCGGGSGSLAVPLAQAGAEVTVVDVSIDALGTLVRRASEAGVSDRVMAVQGDVEALSDLLARATFDVVLAHEVLGSVASLPAAMAEIVAAIRPGGVVSIVVANPVAVVLGRALSGDVDGALTALHKSSESQFSLSSLQGLCEAAGLAIEQVDGVGVFSEIVPGIELERPGAMTALAELEAAASGLAPYRDIAARLHIVARRPVSNRPVTEISQ
ncbi:class I SAM-dependent methyltransferase [Jatrophihabitans sp. DSM 45814]